MQPLDGIGSILLQLEVFPLTFFAATESADKDSVWNDGLCGWRFRFELVGGGIVWGVGGEGRVGSRLHGPLPLAKGA